MNLKAISSLEWGRRKSFLNPTNIISRKQEIKRFFTEEAKMNLTAISSLELGRRKIFHELDVHHVQIIGIKRFWPQETEISLTANSSHESARRKFFMNTTYIMSRKQDSNVFWLRSRNDSNSHQLARMGEKKIFRVLDVHHVQKVGIKRFWAQEAKMSLTAISSLESAREKKIFHELDVHHVWKVGIKLLVSGGRNDSNTHQLARSAGGENFS